MLSRRILLSLAAASTLAACGRSDDDGASGSSTQSSGIPAIGGPFVLVDGEGQTVTEAALKGKWTAIYFGFTYCPDVCPTSLQALAEGLKKLGSKGRDIQTFLISVDPERDTPAVMKAYVANSTFPANLRGLTGTLAQVDAAAKAYKVYYKKDGDGPDYQVQHQSIIYLMNPKGELARPLTGALSPDEIATQIGDALRRGA